MRAHRVVVLATVGAGDQVLAPVFDPAHRALEFHRQPGDDNFFRHQIALVAKAATDIRRNHAQLREIDAEAFGQARADHVRHLGR